MNNYKHKRTKRLVTVLIFFFLTPAAYADGLKVLAENYPPFSYEENGVVTGFDIEILENLIRDSGVKQVGKARIYPWSRAYKTIQKEPDIIVVNMARTEARDALFKWIGPTCPREIWLFKLKSRKDIKINSLEDAKKYRIGSMLGSTSTKELINNGFAKGKNLDLVFDERLNLLKLIKGRVDLITFLKFEMSWRLKRLMHSTDTRIPAIGINDVEPAYLLSDKYQYYFAFSKQVPDSTISKLQNALDTMKKDGRYEKIWKKYME